VLDFGAGRGAKGERAAPETSLVVGIDVSRSVRENRIVDARILFDGVRLPFRDSTFGLCTMRWVVEHLQDPQSVFREVSRVLRPGGRLIFLTPNLWFFAYAAARVIPNIAHPWIVRILTGRQERDTFRTYYRANTQARIRRLLSNSGFRERAIMGFQRGAGYLDFSLPTLLIGAAYDRLVNLTPALAGMRQGLIADFERV